MKSDRGKGPVVKGGCPGIFHRKWQLRRRRESSFYAKYLEALYWSHRANFVKEKVNDVGSRRNGETVKSKSNRLKSIELNEEWDDAVKEVGRICSVRRE